MQWFTVCGNTSHFHDWGEEDTSVPDPLDVSTLIQGACVWWAQQEEILYRKQEEEHHQSIIRQQAAEKASKDRKEKKGGAGEVSASPAPPLPPITILPLPGVEEEEDSSSSEDEEDSEDDDTDESEDDEDEDLVALQSAEMSWDERKEKRDHKQAREESRKRKRIRRDMKTIKRQMKEKRVAAAAAAAATPAPTPAWMKPPPQNSGRAMANSPWRNFQLHPRVHGKFADLFRRKAVSWDTYMNEHDDFEFRIHSIEPIEWFDDTRQMDCTGIGIFGMVDGETRSYVQVRDYGPYGYIGLPEAWTTAPQRNHFVQNVLYGSETFHAILQQEWIQWPKKEVEERASKAHDDESAHQWLFRRFRCFHPTRESQVIMDVHGLKYHDMEVHRHIGHAMGIQVRHEKYLRTLQRFLSHPFVVHCIKVYYNLYTDFEKTKLAPDDNPSMFKLYETNIPFQNRFIVDMNCVPGMWMKIKRHNLTWIPPGHPQRRSHCAFELLVNQLRYPDIQPLPTKMDTVPLRNYSFDIEVLSKKRQFPDSELPEDILYLINLAFWITGQPHWTISVFISDSLDDVWDEAKRKIRFVVRKKNVREFYEILQSILFVLACDTRMAYNNTGFDDYYLWNYAATCGLMSRRPAPMRGFEFTPLVTPDHPFPAWGLLSMTQGYISPCKTVLRQSNQMGTVENNRVLIPGQWCFDLLLEIRLLKKLPSYALKETAKLVGMEKVDLSAQKQFEYFESGEAELHEKIDVYCDKDCAIPHSLHDKFRVTQKYVENCRSNKLQVEDQIWTGQQSRVRQNLLLQCRNDRWYANLFLLPYRDSGRKGKEDDEEEIAPDLSVLAEGHVLQQSVGFNPRKDLYCWDPRFDLELGFVTGPRGPFGRFPVVKRLIFEAKARRDAIVNYMAAMPGSQMSFTYARSDAEAFQEQARQNNKRKYKEQMEDHHQQRDHQRMKMGVDEHDPCPSTEHGQEFAHSSCNHAREGGGAGPPDPAVKMEIGAAKRGAAPFAAAFRTPADSNVAKARFEAEGLWVLSRDDQYKARSLLMKEKAIKVPPKAFPELKKKLVEGATVLVPKRGFYGDPVITFDFEALYPNIIRSRNMSYDTKIRLMHMLKYGYKEGKDYHTVVTKRDEYFFKSSLCSECSAVEKEKGLQAALEHAYYQCSKEVRYEKDYIRKMNYLQGKHYHTWLKEETKVHFTKQICETCSTCPQCEVLRDYIPGAFCKAHQTCNECPQYRHRALICLVVTALLDARSANKAMKSKHGKLKKAVFLKYLELSGQPKATSGDNVLSPDKLPNTFSSQDKAQLGKWWEEYQDQDMLEDIFDMRQAGDKVTCNSTYGWLGAFQGMMSDEDIASSVTGDGRRMIEDIKANSINIHKDQKLNDKHFGRAQLAKDPDRLYHHMCWAVGHEESRDLLELFVNFKDIKFHETLMIPWEVFVESVTKSDVLYGDTDSIMVLFYLHEMFAAIDPPMRRTNLILGFMSCLGQLGAAYLTGRQLKPNNLQYEKAMWPYMLFTRKRYAYVKFELGKHGGEGKRVVQGLGIKRADTFQLLVQTANYLLDHMLRVQPMHLHIQQQPKLIKFMQNVVNRLYLGVVPLVDLTFSMMYGGAHKKQDMPHAHVAYKNQQRNPANIAKAGERVNFGYALQSTQRKCNKKGEYQDPTERLKKWQSAEDIDYMIEHKLPYDPKAYLDRMETLADMAAWYHHAGNIRVAETEEGIPPEMNMEGSSLVVAMSDEEPRDLDLYAPAMKLRDDLPDGAVWRKGQWMMADEVAAAEAAEEAAKIAAAAAGPNALDALIAAEAVAASAATTKKKRKRTTMTKKQIAMWKATSTYNPDLEKSIVGFNSQVASKKVKLDETSRLTPTIADSTRNLSSQTFGTKTRQITLGQVAQLRQHFETQGEVVKPRVMLSWQEAYDITYREYFQTNIHIKVHEMSVTSEQKLLSTKETRAALVNYNVHENMSRYVHAQTKTLAERHLWWTWFLLLRRLGRKWRENAHKWVLVRRLGRKWRENAHQWALNRGRACTYTARVAPLVAMSSPPSSPPVMEELLLPQEEERLEQVTQEVPDMDYF